MKMKKKTKTKTKKEPFQGTPISILRSEKMALCDLYIQPEAAFETVAKLGEMGCVQFVDTKEEVQVFHRSYVTEVRRFNELERKLRFLQVEITSAKINMAKAHEQPNALHPNETLSFENTLDKYESDIIEMTTNEARLKKNYAELIEMQYVLDNIGPLLGGEEDKNKPGKGNAAAAVSTLLQSGHLFIHTGVVDRKRSFPFEVMLWRISRGNVYYKLASVDKIVENPTTGQSQRKVAFLAICQGEELSARAEKVCAGFRVNLYPLPKSFEEREDLSYKLANTIGDLEQVLKKTQFHKCKALRVISRQWNDWSIQVIKSAAVYHNLNRFNYDVTKNCLIGRCWVAERDLHRVQNCLESKSREVGTNIPSFMTKAVITQEVPPTYFLTNKFTAGFQNLINGYGAAKYRELNPGLFTIIIFPFLFAVMFGDVGHGIIMIAFASWMIRSEKKFMNEISTNEIWNIMFAGRYIVLLLGLFSVFTGFIYNDYFSRWINLPTSYMDVVMADDIDSELLENEYVYLDPAKGVGYVFGLEPLYAHSKIKHMHENSLKMKISIILGVIHMEFGLILSLFNHLYFKKYHKIFLQFIPEIVFLTCLFFWLVVMIYMKWFIYSARDEHYSPGCAPQILILFIEMFLLKETQPLGEGCSAYLFSGQRYVQMCLLLVAVLCIPVLLFGTPVYTIMKLKKTQTSVVEHSSDFRRYQRRESDNKEEGKKKDRHEDETFGGLMIHQAIHTVEYVLGTVSHTASYLRLWALSLAHASLSEMLWDMILSKLALKNWEIVGSIMLVVIFAIWAFFTICILVVMEGLSAFLHTLRLHWVEFMTKFFEGGGWLFQPFDFKEIVREHAKNLAHKAPGTSGARQAKNAQN